MVPLRGAAPIAVVSAAAGLAVANMSGVLAVLFGVQGSSIEEGIRAVAITVVATLVSMRLLSAKAKTRDAAASPRSGREPAYDALLSRCIVFGVLGGMFTGVVAKIISTVFRVAGAGPVANIELKTLAISGASWIGVGAIVGLLFGALLLPFTKHAFGRIARRSSDAFDGALVASSNLVVVAGLLGAAWYPIRGSVGVLVLSATTVVLGMIGLAIAAVLDLRRAFWIVRVADGKVAGWSINPNERRLSLGSYVDGVVVVACDAVLTFAKPETPAQERGSPFRSAELAPSAVALIDGTGRLSAKRACIRAAVALGSILFVTVLPAIVLMLMSMAKYNWAGTRGRPVPIAGLDGGDVTAISMGQGGACARHADGKLSCWGYSAGVLLAEPSDYASDRAKPLKAIKAVSAFAVGDGRVCAVPEDKGSEHRAVCWGRNHNGELGDGTKRSPYGAPRPVGPPDVVELAHGQSFTVARTKDGHVWQWGFNPYAERAMLGTSTEPRVVEGITEAVQVAASREHACALDRAGTVICWGHPTSGQTGLKESNYDKIPGIEREYMQPARVEGLPPIDRIVLGGDASTAHRKREDGKHAWWAWGHRHPWGYREHKMSHNPDGWGEVDVLPNTEDMQDIQIGWDAACGLFDDGSVHCWGEGNQGRLGDGNTDLGEHPTSTPVKFGVLAIAGEQYRTCARRQNDVLCWGH